MGWSGLGDDDGRVNVIATCSSYLLHHAGIPILTFWESDFNHSHGSRFHLPVYLGI